MAFALALGCERPLLARPRALTRALEDEEEEEAEEEEVVVVVEGEEEEDAVLLRAEVVGKQSVIFDTTLRTVAEPSSVSESGQARLAFAAAGGGGGGGAPSIPAPGVMRRTLTRSSGWSREKNSCA